MSKFLLLVYNSESGANFEQNGQLRKERSHTAVSSVSRSHECIICNDRSHSIVGTEYTIHSKKNTEIKNYTHICAGTGGHMKDESPKGF